MHEVAVVRSTYLKLGEEVI